MTRARRLLLPALIIAIAISFTPILNFAGLGVDQAYAAAKVKAPKNVKVKVVSQTALKISWGKVKGAKGYTVYQKKGSKFKAVKTLKGKSMTVKNLKAGTKYTFYVKAFKKKGKKKIYSKASKKVSAKTKAAVTPAPQPAVTEPTAVCKNGKFVGTEEASGVVSFKGIPYAKPPVGDLRWKAPQPPEASDAVIEAKEFGHPAVQANYPLPEPASGSEGVSWVFDPMKYTASEDCLTLNVWMDPANKTEKKPVMVWFHGGGFVVGSTTNEAYQLENFVKQEKDMIMVSANYRLGMLGSMDLSEVQEGEKYKKEDFREAQNLALLDYIQAIRWVKENIAAFGGDPNNITIFGNSAGAADVTILTLCNDKDIQDGNLFQRVIAQSGGLALYENVNDMEDNSVSKGDRKKWTDQLMKLVGAKNLDDLMNVSEADLINAYTGYFDPEHPEAGAKPMAEADPRTETACLAYNAACPISGDAAGLLDADLYEAAKTKGKNIDVIYGSNQNEWNYWVYEMAMFDEAADHPIPLLDMDNDVYTFGFIPDKMANELGKAVSEGEMQNNVTPFLNLGTVAAMRQEPRDMPDEAWKGLIAAFWGLPSTDVVTEEMIAMFKEYESRVYVDTEIYNDLTFRGPAIAAAESHAGGPGKTYMYYWAKETGQKYQGASHASEISYVLSNPNHTCFSGEVNMDLAKQMTAMWANFARTGDPSINGVDWEQYDGTKRSTMTIGFEGDKEDISLKMIDMVKKENPTGAVEKRVNDLAEQYELVKPLLKYRLK